jgi:hypothetical protein
MSSPSITISVLPAEPSDCRTMAEVDYAAFSDDLAAQVLFGSVPTEAGLSHRTQEIADKMANNPTVRFTKAVVDDKLVAWAEWHYYLDTEKDEKEDEDQQSWPEGANVEACEEMFGKLHRFRQERMAGTRHARTCSTFPLDNFFPLSFLLRNFSQISSPRLSRHDPRFSRPRAWFRATPAGSLHRDQGEDTRLVGILSARISTVSEIWV